MRLMHLFARLSSLTVVAPAAQCGGVTRDGGVPCPGAGGRRHRYELRVGAVIKGPGVTSWLLHVQTATPSAGPTKRHQRLATGCQSLMALPPPSPPPPQGAATNHRGDGVASRSGRARGRADRAVPRSPRTGPGSAERAVPTSTALCVMGQPRTLHHASVQRSQHAFLLEPLRAQGTVDVFAVVSAFSDAPVVARAYGLHERSVRVVPIARATDQFERFAVCYGQISAAEKARGGAPFDWLVRPGLAPASPRPGCRHVAAAAGGRLRDRPCTRFISRNHRR